MQKIILLLCFVYPTIEYDPYSTIKIEDATSVINESRLNHLEGTQAATAPIADQPADRHANVCAAVVHEDEMIGVESTSAAVELVIPTSKNASESLVADETNSVNAAIDVLIGLENVAVINQEVSITEAIAAAMALAANFVIDSQPINTVSNDLLNMNVVGGQADFPDRLPSADGTDGLVNPVRVNRLISSTLNLESAPCTHFGSITMSDVSSEPFSMSTETANAMKDIELD